MPFEVEKDPYCRRVISCRIADGLVEAAPLIEDITNFYPTEEMVTQAEGFTLGFPCQAIS